MDVVTSIPWPIIQTAIVSSVGAVVVWVGKEVRIIKNRQKHTHFEMRATHKALEQSMGNGFSKTFDTELNRLIKEDIFVRTGE